MAAGRWRKYRNSSSGLVLRLLERPRNRLSHRLGARRIALLHSSSGDVVVTATLPLGYIWYIMQDDVAAMYGCWTLRVSSPVANVMSYVGSAPYSFMDQF